VPVLALILLAVLTRPRKETHQRLRSIDRKCGAAQRQARDSGELFGELAGQLADLQSSAHMIVSKLDTDDMAERAGRRATLQAELARLEQQLQMATDERVRAECQAAVDGKRSALEALQSIETQREWCVMRLSKIEAAVDAALAKMDAVKLQFAADGNEDAAIGSLRLELDLVRKTLDDIRSDFG